MDKRTKAAEHLRKVSTRLEAAARDSLTWADLKAANKHFEQCLSGVMDNAIRDGLVPDIDPGLSVVVTGGGEWVNWIGIRKAAGTGARQWLAKFDADGPAETKWVYRFTPDPNGVDLCDMNVERIEVSTELSADDRRAWYRRQSLAWAWTIRVLARRIEGEHTATGSEGETEEPPPDPAIWKREVVQNLKLKQRALAEAINNSPGHEISIEDFAETVGWESPFDNAAKNLAKRLNESLKKLGSSRLVHRCDNRFQVKKPE